jgi:hypothetical protein
VSGLRRASAFRTHGRSGGSQNGPQEALEAPRAYRVGDDHPTWEAVETLVAKLAETGAIFATTTSDTNWISGYEPGKRFMVQTDSRSSWVQLEHLKACWETLEELGSISKADVLEPGRCSAVVMAIFGQVPGVVHVSPKRLGLPARDVAGGGAN